MRPSSRKSSRVPPHFGQRKPSGVQRNNTSASSSILVLPHGFAGPSPVGSNGLQTGQRNWQMSRKSWYWPQWGGVISGVTLSGCQPGEPNRLGKPRNFSDETHSITFGATGMSNAGASDVRGPTARGSAHKRRRAACSSLPLLTPEYISRHERWCVSLSDFLAGTIAVFADLLMYGRQVHDGRDARVAVLRDQLEPPNATDRDTVDDDLRARERDVRDDLQTRRPHAHPLGRPTVRLRWRRCPAGILRQLEAVGTELQLDAVIG